MKSLTVSILYFMASVLWANSASDVGFTWLPDFQENRVSINVANNSEAAISVNEYFKFGFSTIADYSDENVGRISSQVVGHLPNDKSYHFVVLFLKNVSTRVANSRSFGIGKLPPPIVIQAGKSARISRTIDGITNWDINDFQYIVCLSVFEQKIVDSQVFEQSSGENWTVIGRK